MIHYHGTPITPVSALYELAGRCFCVSFQRPQDIERVHMIGQSVMLDNGAYSAWKLGRQTRWGEYYAWCDRWLQSASTWAVIPDEIDSGAQLQDALIAEWPFGEKGAPVWHMDEPIDRFLRLIDMWPRVCIGSTDRYTIVMSPVWQQRMDAVWNEVARVRRFMPNVHMLRGMQLSGERWPFASVDSTDIGRNHNRPQNTPRQMADRWDALQTPLTWAVRPIQEDIFDVA